MIWRNTIEHFPEKMKFGKLFYHMWIFTNNTVRPLGLIPIDYSSALINEFSIYYGVKQAGNFNELRTVIH